MAILLVLFFVLSAVYISPPTIPRVTAPLYRPTLKLTTPVSNTGGEGNEFYCRTDLECKQQSALGYATCEDGVCQYVDPSQENPCNEANQCFVVLSGNIATGITTFECLSLESQAFTGRSNCDDPPPTICTMGTMQVTPNIQCTPNKDWVSLGIPIPTTDNLAWMTLASTTAELLKSQNPLIPLQIIA